MKFVKNTKNLEPLIDNVFTVVDQVNKAKKVSNPENIFDATIGSLADENNVLVALDSVYTSFRKLSNQDFARYASSFSGNKTYKDAMDKWLFGDIKMQLNRCIIATPGGSGALSTTIFNMLQPGETLIIPDIGWSSYALMGNEYGLNIDEYEMFDQDNNYNLSSIKLAIMRSLLKQNKAVIIINDPCHNPTGYSMSLKEWQELCDFINLESKNGEIVLINDIAYIDYSYNQEHKKDYMELFNHFNDNVLVVLAYSCSKAFTFYGMRCGCVIPMSKNKNLINKLQDVYDRSCRAFWSNIPNSPMLAFADIIENHQKEYLEEKAKYINLLKKRSEIFVKEAYECQLSCYPYQDGFFITLKVPDNRFVDLLHEAMIQHNIFAIKVNKGIRIGVCSLSIIQISGLAKKIKVIWEAL